MNTELRAHALADACRNFEHLLGRVSAEVFLDWVRLELGHEAALDGFQPIGGQYLRANPPGSDFTHCQRQHSACGVAESCARAAARLAQSLQAAERGIARKRMRLLPRCRRRSRDRVEFTMAKPDAWLYITRML